MMIKQQEKTESPLPPFSKGGQRGISSDSGFTLVELMITMLIFVFVMAAASSVFTGLLTQFKQQTKLAETNIEGVIGLEILRQDIEHAGYGLPWHVEIDGDGDRNDWEQLANYNESSTNPYSLNDATTAAPRAILSKNSATFSSPNNIFDGSDYLVIKSVNVARNEACYKFTVLKPAPFTSPYNPRVWTPASENLANTDRVIVLSTGTTAANARTLTVNGSAFYTTYNNITSSPWPPTQAGDTSLVYGINTSSAATPARPFNRADYSIRIPTTGNVPSRCAPNTGILYKATMNHDAAGSFNYLPLLDCVADMQVVYGLDNDGDGDFEPLAGDGYSEDIVTVPLSASDIRAQVKQVRVYILAQEGQRDPNYTYPSSTVFVGETGLGGSSFDLTTITGWQNYRWKLYSIIVTPNNLD